jgi:hypothetical protein
MVSLATQESPLFHELLLEEILEVRRTSSRGRKNPRAVKRKMSSYPTKSRQLPGAEQADATIRIEAK